HLLRGDAALGQRNQVRRSRARRAGAGEDEGGRSRPVRAESHRRTPGTLARVLGLVHQRRLEQRQQDALKTSTQTRHVMDLLETQHPDADTELHYKNAYQLLVAT